ncbi:hypothetical protein X560_0916 [Listeria fleischmannii 1991]|nr:DUF1129 family protein [Listeria fleischmannii]EMG27131.1 hypothetical protein LFLEISCH_12760 [Listeria fleischmannii subsp. fleischmannii LU2006-1]KMT59990.1 hypothetical protein X560_0916 [Listeria fleischmannii 1991]
MTIEINNISLSEQKEKLTKKNLQYVQEVEKHLRQTDYPESQQETIISEMVEKILAEQKQGVTARKLFDLTPTEYVTSLTVKATKIANEPNTSKWWLGLDGGLLVLGAMMLISGLSAYFQGQTLGLAVLLITGIIGGFAMIILRRYATEMRAGRKGGTLRYILMAVLVIAIWMFVMTMVQIMVPPAINVALDPTVMVIAGAAILALRWYIKRKKNIPSL